MKRLLFAASVITVSVLIFAVGNRRAIVGDAPPPPIPSLVAERIVQFSEEAFDHLNPGATAAEVREVLGEPQSIRPIAHAANANEVWSYPSRSANPSDRHAHRLVLNASGVVIEKSYRF